MSSKFYSKISILVTSLMILSACSSPASIAPTLQPTATQTPQPTATQAPQTNSFASLPDGHKTTRWIIEPNIALDALCFFTTLTGDPFYLAYYQKEYDRFAPKLTAEVKKAVAEIKSIIEEDKGLICPVLTQIFSPLDPKTLDNLIQAVDNPETVRLSMKIPPPPDNEGWIKFMGQVPNLRSVFYWMKEAGFEQDYQENFYPQIEAKAKELTQLASAYNIIPGIEAALGVALPSDTITIYLSHYVNPFGIGLDANKSLLLADLDIQTIIDDSIHENLHLLDTQEPALWEAVSTLQQDNYYMQSIQSHDFSNGYATFEAYLEEDLVEGLDQFLAEKVGAAEDARLRWSKSLAGMNILSPVVYSLLKQENYSPATETYHDFLIRMVKEGKLKAGMIESANLQFYEGGE